MKNINTRNDNKPFIGRDTKNGCSTMKELNRTNQQIFNHNNKHDLASDDV